MPRERVVEIVYREPIIEFKTHPNTWSGSHNVIVGEALKSIRIPDSLYYGASPEISGIRYGNPDNEIVFIDIPYENVVKVVMYS